MSYLLLLTLTSLYSRVVQLHANLYGPESKSVEIGSGLSAHGAYLQPPRHARLEDNYLNPHEISFEGVSESDTWLQQLQNTLSGAASFTSLDWSSVLDDLPQYSEYGGSTDTTLMTTDMFSHQLIAQNYMSRREIGQLENCMKFWQLESTDTGAPIYRHVVTGQEEYDISAEPQGGILADHMGLGKTLSTISLIAASLDRAEAFAGGPVSVYLNGSIPLANIKGTLVIVPSVLLIEEWEKEVAKHTQQNSVKITRYHGQGRVKHFASLRDFDIVLTTYGTLTKELSKLWVQSRDVIYHLKWFRVVLDEAHTIRSQRTRQFEAVLSLQAQHHWCLTGTPVSNKIEDLEALIRVCRVPLLQDHVVFRNNVTKVAKRSFPQACRILHHTLSPICLRRTKALLEIPEPTSVEYVLEFSSPEKKMYKDLEAHYSNMMNKSVSTKGSAYNIMFQAILQLRILCDQGAYYNMPQDEEESMDADEALSLLEQKGKAICAGCSGEVFIVNQAKELNSGSMGSCGHVICHLCFEVALESGKQQGRYQCPECDQNVDQRSHIDHRDLTDIDMSLRHGKCAKMDRLLQDLLQHHSQAKRYVSADPLKRCCKILKLIQT